MASNLLPPDGMFPIVDLALFRQNKSAGAKEIIEAVKKACSQHGFMIVVNHGVDETVIDRAYQSARSFFDLPQKTKETYISKTYRGYIALGGLAAAYSLDDRANAPDYREMFVMSRDELDLSDLYYASETGRTVFAPNIWPNEIPAFKSDWMDYYSEMEVLAFDLMDLFAEAWGLPVNWFKPSINKHMSTMMVTNYPEQLKEPLPGQLRCGAHTDYGTITLLRAEDKPGGLEVLNEHNEWVTVPIIPNSFIINIGDLMQRWTNDQWRSSYHRVTNPPRGTDLETRRQSLIFFFHPNYDVVIEPLPGITDDRKYPSVTARQHLIEKITKMQTAKD